MLMKFAVRNFKNFNEDLEFDLSDVKQYEFNTNCIKNKIVDKAIVYGVNGSGKSNLGFAIFDIVTHLTDKQKNPDFYANYLYAGNTDLIAEFKYIFSFSDRKIEYSYGKKNVEDIVYETVSIDGKEIISMDRRKSYKVDINMSGAENLNTDLRNTKISAVKYILSNTILENNEDNFVFKEFATFVDNMLFFRSLGENNYLGYEIGGHSLLDDILERDHLQDFEDFLNKAGISCKLDTIEENKKEIIVFCLGDKKLDFFKSASTGTRALTLFYYWLQRLKEERDVSFLFIDEFDAFYHYSLSRLIVEELRDLPSQTIITTHNISLMTNDLLRPDCYYILEKNKIKSTANMTEKDLRKAHNMEKMYRAGVFNA